ncbi:MAG: hypothetical protein Q9167_006196 [Letrouitia subvulpina]
MEGETKSLHCFTACSFYAFVKSFTRAGLAYTYLVDYPPQITTLSIKKHADFAMIEEPYILAELHQNPFGSNSKVYASDVFSLVGSEKRKRSEIALASDNQNITIYDVREISHNDSEDRLTVLRLDRLSCLLPMRFLLMQPLRVRHVLSDIDGRRPRLPKELLIALLSRHNLDYYGFRNRFVQIEVLPNGSASGNIQVLVVFQDGRIACFSEDLSEELWGKYVLSIDGSSPQESIQVEFATVISANRARKAFFKGGQDILVDTDSSREPVGVHLLFLLTRHPPTESKDQSRLIFRSITVKVANPDPTSSSIGKTHYLQELDSVAIPEPQSFLPRESVYTLHSSTGVLYQSDPRSLAVYDLTKAVPRLLHQIRSGQSSCSSWLRINSSLVGVASAGSLSLVDMQYHSLQAKRGLQIPARAGQRRGVIKNTNTRLLSYYASLDVVVALQDLKLMMVQLSTTSVQPNGSRKRARNGMLIDSIGRGVIRSNQNVIEKRPHGIAQFLRPPEDEDSEWTKAKGHLESLAPKGEAREFDDLVMSLLRIPKQSNSKTKASASFRSINISQIHYILSRIFSVSDNENIINEGGQKIHMLNLNFFPLKTFKYIIQNGLLTVAQVESALKNVGSLDSIHELDKSALVYALAASDQSMATLLSLLESPCPLEATQLVLVLRLTMCHLSDLATSADAKYSTTGVYVNGLDTSRKGRMEMAANDMANKSNIQSKRRKNARAIFQLVVRRTFVHPTSHLIQALKSGLSKSELRNIVDLLRIEMATNGWLSTYAEDISLPKLGQKKTDHQIEMIVRLLNCVVDSIGSGGWILGASTADGLTEAADTIAYMKAEISAALEGIEEAVYLKGMLAEVLQCGKSSLGPKIKRSFQLRNSESNVLPLGLKLGPEIPLTKVDAGGELRKRSARDISKLMSRQVPKYSFERIRI